MRHSRDEVAAALAQLSLPEAELGDPLEEVLERAIGLLDADTAAVLLLDVSGKELVATAARGLEQEVRQGVRVPVGHGFAGRIAAERRPILLDRIDESTVRNPILWRRGIQHMLGVPIEVEGRLLGVLHVGSLTDHAFDERDAEVLELIAERVGTTLQIQMVQADRRTAAVVQRSLLPSVPSRIGPFECAARYVPAGHGGIGGDWYDVFEVDGGSVWIVVGDIAGHGLHAATVMGRVRSALRAYALISDQPEEVLAMTDRKMAHFEFGAMATAVAAVIHPPFERALIATAGHPTPMVADDDGARALDIGIGPPLGVAVGPRPPADVVPLAEGDVLVAFTDGLIERRGELIDTGIERVLSALTAASPAQVCAEVMASAVGDTVPEDDIALLALRRTE